MDRVADATAIVQEPKGLSEEPKLDGALDGTTVSLSAGGLLSTGNSQLIAGTLNGVVETQWSGNAISLSLLGNYGRGAPPGQPSEVTTENLQARARYERFLSGRASVFLINSARHDRFQGIDLRYNVDPGFKYMMLKLRKSAFWAEAGYDFQYDIRRDDALMLGDPTSTDVTVLPKVQSDHSVRGFLGFRYSFSTEISFLTGVEYLQSFLVVNQYRLNYDALFTSKIGAGLAVGLGFSARYDHQPLPGKESIDTATTVSLVYALTTVKAAPKPQPPCNCPRAPACASQTPPSPPPVDTTPPP